MRMNYGIELGTEHYAGVVDLLGRFGFVKCSYEFIKRMPIHPTISVQGALLWACRMHRKLKLGNFCSREII